jgi:hypothetical protein
VTLSTGAGTITAFIFTGTFGSGLNNAGGPVIRAELNSALSFIFTDRASAPPNVLSGDATVGTGSISYSSDSSVALDVARLGRAPHALVPPGRSVARDDGERDVPAAHGGELLADGFERHAQGAKVRLDAVGGVVVPVVAVELLGGEVLGNARHEGPPETATPPPR